ncbi:MAG: hypothetical protein ACTHN3_07440 [Solirubrobacterales bacterium]
MQWNVLSGTGEPYEYYKREFSSWLEDATSMGLVLDVSLTRYPNTPFPASQAQLKEQLHNILSFASSRGDAISFIEPWNEPNNQGGLAPTEAAEYANSANTVCHESPSCTVVAGNFEDNPYVQGEVENYRSHLNFSPAYWGVHPYYSVQYMERKYYENFLHGLANNGVGYRIWFTEVAARRCTASTNNGEGGQGERAGWLVNNLMPFASPEHVFYYEFLLRERKEPSCGEVDDALYAPSGDPNAPDRPRPAASYVYGGAAIPWGYTGGTELNPAGRSATLTGSVYPEEFGDARYQFEYSTSPYTVGEGPHGALSAEGDAGSAIGPSTARATISGLAPNTAYHYRITAWNGHGRSYGEDHSFTLVVPPDASTSEATELQPTQARVNGSVNPNGADTHYYFEYGPTTGYGNVIPPSEGMDIGSGFEGVACWNVINNLEPVMTYHYRVVASSGSGRTYGADRQFTTPPGAPFVTAEAATGVKAHSATMRGSINPRGSETTYHFEYDTKPYAANEAPHGTSVPVPDASAGSGRSAVAEIREITGLQIGTTYHFRLVGSNAGGTTYGSDQEFRTANVPAVTGESATYVNTFEPELNASINPEGAATEYQFEYGLTEAYGTKIPATAASIGGGRQAVAVSQTLKGLERNKTYHFRVVATNEAGTTRGTDKSFATLPYCKGGSPECSWTNQSLAHVPAKTEDETRGVSCVSATSCYAIDFNKFREDSFTERWNGSEWSVASSGVPGEMNGISCLPGSIFCMAVGVDAGVPHYWEMTNGGAGYPNAGAVPTPSGATQFTLRSVSCTAESACTAVGYYRKPGETNEWHPLAERWNGSAWTIQTAPDPLEGAGEKAMMSVSCTSATSCTTVGSAAHKPVAASWNGTAWSNVTAANPAGSAEATLEGLSCTSTTACMAVGHFHESGGKDKSLAESWNGTAWEVKATPALAEAVGGYDLYSVSCLSGSSCFAVGARISKEEEVAGFPVVREQRTVAETWNGSQWTAQTTPSAENAKSLLTTVSCTSSIACTAAGSATPGPSGESVGMLGERYE